MHELISIHKTGFRLLKKIHSVDSAIIPLHMLEVFLSLAQVYASLFLTSVLIDLLLAGNFPDAGIMAVWLLLVNLLFGVAVHLTKRKFRGMKNKIWILFYVWLREKAFSLDYETMENPEVAEKILFSERTSDVHGGLGILLYHYLEILRAALHILLSVSLIVYLCMAAPRIPNAVLSTLAHPLPSAILFAGVLAGMILSSFRVFKKFAQKQQEIFDNHTGVENK